MTRRLFAAALVASIGCASNPPSTAGAPPDRDATVNAPDAPTPASPAFDASSDDGNPDADDPSADGEAVDAGPSPGLVVQVVGGLLQGQLAPDVRVREFLGIPYGASTDGAGRFAPPRPAAPWTGTRAATAYGPRCEQLALGAGPSEGMSEDCLSLNVFAPADAVRGPTPVMVFLPGGGFQVGGSADAPGQYLSAAAQAVVVTVNYRVGPLAFMAHPALDAALGVPSGNLGLRDQRLALQWVHDNVGAFGGDPDAVTLFGQSAGALSTCIHQFSPGSQGLAQRFVIESGACVAGTGAPRTRAFMVQATTDLANQLCPVATDLVACLRQVPASDFVSILGAGNVAAKFWPYVDGDVLPDAPWRLLADGRLSEAPFIVGSNEHEYAYFEDLYGYPKMNNRSDLALNVTLNYASHAQAILDHYMPATDGEADAAYGRLWTDEYFRCPARALVRGAAAAGRAARLYSFDAPPAAHAQELDYVFGFPCCGVSWRFPDAAAIPPTPDLVRTIQGYWSAFARTGEPSAAGLPPWPVYDRMSDDNVVFAQPVEMASHLSEADCDFWDGIYAANR